MTQSLATLLSLSFAFALYLPGAQAANKTTAMQNIQQSCQSDIQKYCSDVTKGQGRVMACLKAHEDKLSDSCNKQWTQAKNEWRNTMKGMHQACAGDVQKFCSNADNPRDVRNCLNDHQSDLTTACRDFRTKNNMG